MSKSNANSENFKNRKQRIRKRHHKRYHKPNPYPKYSRSDQNKRSESNFLQELNKLEYYRRITVNKLANSNVSTKKKTFLFNKLGIIYQELNTLKNRLKQTQDMAEQIEIFYMNLDYIRINLSYISNKINICCRICLTSC